MTRAVAAVLLMLAACAAPGPAGRNLGFRVHHLGTPDQPEWEEFADDPPAGRELDVTFDALPNEAEETVLLWQDNVRHRWDVLLNGAKLGQLVLSDLPTLAAFAVPPKTLFRVKNVLSIRPPQDVEDIRVGFVRHVPKPLAEVVGEAALDVDVLEAPAGKEGPCRITIVNEDLEALPPLAALPGQRLAVRHGCVYTPDGKARLRLPAGRYRVHAGRGFEFSLGTARVVLTAGAPASVRLTIRREVPTGNLVSVDPHLHTLQLSGHGDATVDERVLTIEGEGLDVAVATEHNRRAHYGVSPRFTSVAGSEITTPEGHFNVFPVDADTALPDFRQKDWSRLLSQIRETPGVKVVILNHPRNDHQGFVPFAPGRFNPVSGEHEREKSFGFDAMELLNSSALRTDDLQVIRDWMAVLNRGHRVVGLATSDSHEVNRFIAGQGRTYVTCRDADPSKVDVSELCESLKQGRAVACLGLLVRMTVDGKFGPGDLVAKAGPALEVEISVLGPSWTRADRLELYLNGTLYRREALSGGTAGGEKARVRWRIPRPPHDAHLVAVATGPGVTDPSWPLARPYQPTSTRWTPRVIGVANPVWVDGDGDGAYASPRAVAEKLVEVHADAGELLKAIAEGDEAIGVQAAAALRARGRPFEGEPWASAPDKIRRGFEAYAASLR